jgi:hypothetical protein
MKRNKILLIAAMLLYCTTTSATTAEPTIYYTYDNTGNRTGRIIITEEDGPSKAGRKNGNNSDTTDVPEEKKDNPLTSEQKITEQLQSTDVKIYPNPTAGLLNIETNSNVESLQYLFTGSGGEVLHSGQINNQSAILDISRYARGIYYLTLYNGKEKRVWKIIKQ